MKKLLLFLLLCFAFSSMTTLAQNPSRVVLQAFWWNYWNNNYPNGWYNYLTELAPRLKDYGVDAVWIPPTSKGGGGTSDVGYGIFDHYDLGDKYQKGEVRTRLGTKDEYLRMVAVLHANGIDIIQDIVLNHVNGAGPLGAVDGDDRGGKDPNAPDNQWKNFRYTSYSHRATDESANDYLNRNGRWFKDYQNFHKSGGNFGHNDYDYPQHGEMFGPDICYSADAINTNGPRSTAATYGLQSMYDPNQYSDYMKQEAIKWGIWLKKQTGVDGFRLDAAKHFEWDVTEAFLWNTQNNAGWASGGNGMFAVSEYIPEGGQPSMENFMDGVQNRTGTFDFNLRDAIYSMVSGNGFYNIANIPGAQVDQAHRGRVVSFINNHDTFRPQLDASGNYVGWNGGDELRPHIDPFVDRLPAAYAIAAAVDGSVQVFFEDLFNIGGTGLRYSHLPTNGVDLPVRDHIKKIIQARRVLGFDQGTYKVRSAEPGASYSVGSSNQDLLIIERSAKAIIGVNDNGSNWQSCWIDTDFPQNTILKDYSGANGNWTYIVPADHRVYVNVPPANSQYGGYCIIAPDGFNLNVFNPAQRTTTQEWEMANDLGDSHPYSLKQGGAIPQFGIRFDPRTAGNVFSETGKMITVQLYPEVTGKLARTLGLQICNSSGTVVSSTSGKGTLTLNYTPASTGYYTIKVYNNQANSLGQKAWVKATYTAPKIVDTSLYGSGSGSPIMKLSAKDELINEEDGPVKIICYPTPFNPTANISVDLKSEGNLKVEVFNMLGQSIAILHNGFSNKGTKIFNWNGSNFASGIYFYNVTFNGKSQIGKMILAK